MGRDDQERNGSEPKTDLLAYLMSQNASALGRIEAKLTAIEGHLSRRLTPEQIIKLAIGIGLPLAVLLATGNADVAKRFIGLF